MTRHSRAWHEMHDAALAEAAEVRAFEAMPTMMVAGAELLSLLHQHTEDLHAAVWVPGDKRAEHREHRAHYRQTGDFD